MSDPSAAPAHRRARRARLAATVLLAAGAAVQVAIAVVADVRLLATMPVRWLTEPEDPPNPEAAAVRALPRVLDSVPRADRVLFVTGVPARIQYQFYVLPRPFRLLVHFPEPLVAAAATIDPFYGWFAQLRRRLLDERAQLLTPERLRAAVDDADWLVAFHLDESLLDGLRLRPVARIERIQLYAVQR